MAKQFMILGRFTIDGYAVVDADTAEEAKKRFDVGDFEIEYNGCSIADWERRGKPEDCA